VSIIEVRRGARAEEAMQHTHNIDTVLQVYTEIVERGEIVNGEKLTDEMVSRYIGVLRSGAREYAESYGGENTFMLDMRTNAARGWSLSLAQVRGIVNCLVADARMEATKAALEKRPITRSQIIDIHTIVRTLGWDDAEYRDVLLARYACDTSKALSEVQAAEFLRDIAAQARGMVE
jgi:hypothetical protein